MDIAELALKAKNKSDFVQFLDSLKSDYDLNKGEWENNELGRYIEAMQRFMEDSTENSMNQIEFVPSWSLFARIMLAASMYE